MLTALAFSAFIWSTL